MSRGRALVTGYSGFIGRHLLPLLATDFDIVAIGRSKPSLPDLAWIKFDLLSDDLNTLRVTGRDVLIHLAWSLPHGEYWTDSSNALWLQRSLELVRHFLLSGGTRVHITGTCAEYDWSAAMPLNESSSPVIPKGAYGKCKNALHLGCARLCSRFDASLGWYRIFWPYGWDQDDKKFIPGLIHALARGNMTSCLSANLARDYIHVDDVANLIAAAIRSDFSGCLNTGSGKATPLGKIALKIARFLGKEHLLALGQQEISADNPPVVCADVDKQKDIPDYNPAYDIDTGIIDTIKKIIQER